MDIHPCQIGFAVALHHAKELPSVPFIETGVVGNEINRRNAFGTQILHSHMQQVSGNAPAAERFFGIYCANIGSQIFSVMEIVFDDTRSANQLS